jgi:hypothetical protein
MANNCIATVPPRTSAHMSMRKGGIEDDIEKP